MHRLARASGSGLNEIATQVCEAQLMLPRRTFLASLAAPVLSAQRPARLNEIQVLGSHNSYKIVMDKALQQLLEPSMGERLKGLLYTHAPLEEQLNLGLRALELDVVHDPEGGRYAKPGGNEWLKAKGLPTGATFDPEGHMLRPGLKVLHVQDIDFRTHCYTFQDALAQLKGWSAAHPGHLPILITMNAKDDAIDKPEFVRPLPFDAAAFAAWDQEILRGLGREKLITPDDVRGKAKSLEAAVLGGGWPELDKVRGKFLFALDERGKKLETYLDGHASLEGRMMFALAPVGNPASAFHICNDAKKQTAEIGKLVRAGYLVRTRADSDTREARRNDYSTFEAAKLSGAHIISTDYYNADPELGTSYQVRLNPRWNPLNAMARKGDLKA